MNLKPKSCCQVYRSFRFILITLVISFVFISRSAATEGLAISHINDVTHIEIAGIGANDYQADKKNNTVELKVNDLTSGQIAKLKNYRDKHITRIEVSQSAALDQSIVKIYLSSNAVDMFDYLTDSPPSLSVDFYFDDEKQEKIAKESKEKIQKNSKNEKNNANSDVNESQISRKLASDEFIKQIEGASLLADLDGNKNKINKQDGKNKNNRKAIKNYDVRDTLDIDVEKIHFDPHLIIEAREMIFLKFPLLLNENQYLSSMLSRRVTYEIADAGDTETKDFFKSKKMFDKNDYKVFFKSKKIFQKKYPKSKYNEMINFMGADALLQVYKKEKNPELFEEALKTYDALLSRYPKSALSERTYLLTSFLRIKEGKYLEATRNLKTYIERYRTSPIRENIRLILAQSLLRLQQYRDAALIYEELIKSDANDVRETAMFEAGDVFLEKKDYKNAIKYYEGALSAYPQAASKYPNVFFNLGEAQFLMEDYSNSLQSFKGFLRSYPQHEFSSYAWTRMGEMLEIAEKGEKVWRGFYNESIFRFKSDTGAKIAEAHLLYHDAIKAPQHKLHLYLDKLEQLGKEIHLTYAAGFIAFKIADVYYGRGDFKKSTDHLIAFFRNEQIPLEADKFHKRIGRSLLAMFKDELAHGTPDSALMALKNYDELWFKKSNLLSFDFIKGQIYENAGLYDLAEIYIEKYLKRAKSMELLESSEKVPSKSLVYLILTRALLNNNKVPSALENFKNIHVSELNDGEADDYIRLQRDIALQRKDLDESIKFSENIKSPNKKDMRLLASIYSQNHNYKNAVLTVDKYVNGYKLDSKEKFDILKDKVSYLQANNDKEKYNTFLKKFYDEFKETKFQFDKERFDLGKVYTEEGNYKTAQEIWSTITDGSIWQKLARESQQENDWNKKYEKYVDRVPAMQKK